MGVCTWWNLIPRWNSSGDEIIPCLWWNVSYCLQVFAEMKFHHRMNSSLSKRQGWNFIPGSKIKNRRVNASSRDEILKWAFLFKNFWRMYSNMLSKVIVFDHNENMNIMRPLFEKWSPKRKRMGTTSKM